MYPYSACRNWRTEGEARKNGRPVERVLAVRAITSAIGEVVFGRPSGAHESQIVGTAAATKAEDHDGGKDRRTAHKPENGAMHGPEHRTSTTRVVLLSENRHQSRLELIQDE